MVALATLPHSWTVEEYLAMERTSEVRHEYIDGVVYALAGGTLAHNRIAVNLTTALDIALRDGSCRVYSSDVRVQLTPERYVYPDLSVRCAAGDRGDGGALFLADPTVAVEVLSTKTAAYDRGGKFDFYRQVASLRDYVLVETAHPSVEVRSRGEGGAWSPRTYGAGEWVELPSLGVRLQVDSIYRNVELDEAD
jgi:Uma2 family endonuclease